MKQPIMEFENEKQLNQCLKYWKNKLFLNDWVIKVKLVEAETLDDGETSGKNEFQIINKASVITIAIGNEDNRSRMIKLCHEKTLIHELLHCKYNWVRRDYDSIEVVYYDELEHGLLEQMAKSLLMVKYDLDFSWFENFKK